MKRDDLPFDKVMPIPEEWKDNDVMGRILKDVEDELGWKCFLGSARNNLKFLLPIIQRHMKKG